jgi:SAM-dependent methyltransferase
MGEVDFGKAAADYATHRSGFPERTWNELAKAGLDFTGKRAVDLGTGTGAAARALALRGAHVVGIDPSVALTEQASNLDAQAGVSVRYVEATAEATGLEPASADIVIAAQCWWWFDRPAAMAEATRVLAPGGWLVICSFDWLTLPGNVVEATERLIVAANPQWTMGGRNGRHPEWLEELKVGGLEGILAFEFEHDAPYSHEAWRGRIRASAGVAASLPPEEVRQFDERLAVTLSAGFPDPLLAAHRVYAALGQKPS